MKNSLVVVLATSVGLWACQISDRVSVEEVAELQLERVAVLGSANDSISVNGFAIVMQVADSSYLVAGQPFPRDRLLHYSSSGKLLGTVGRPGSGPDEFRAIVAMARMGDSLAVFELGGAVKSISRDMVVRPYLTVPTMIQRAWVSANGDVVVMSPTRRGAPLHRYRDGQLLAVGPPTDSVPEDRPSMRHRHAVFNPDGSAWLVRPDRYELELVDSTGSVVRRFERAVPWFPNRDYELTLHPEPPSPFIVDLTRGPDGSLLVLARVANDPYDPSMPRGEGVRLTPDYMRRMYDGIIEVLDPETGAVVTSRRTDVPFQGFAARDRLYSLREDESGLILIDVWHVGMANE